MKTDIRRRLARLEAKLGNGAASEVDMESYQVQLALMSIVCFHAGKLSAGESLESALDRALDMKHGKLKSAVKPHIDDGPDVWALILEKLQTIISARCELPDIVGRPSDLDVLGKLYAEIPDEMKTSHGLRPFLADYQ